MGAYCCSDENTKNGPTGLPIGEFDGVNGAEAIEKKVIRIQANYRGYRTRVELESRGTKVVWNSSHS